MKIKELLKGQMRGSVATYVMIMFGLIVVLYLFGFQPPWMAYQAETVAGGEDTITTAPQGAGYVLLQSMMTSMKGIFNAIADNPEWGILGGVLAILGLVAIVKLGGQYVLAYIIPLLLLTLFANIFLFPTAYIGKQLFAPFDLIILGFLNLFMILAIIDFVRSGN
jgi:hypothetical protein